MTRTQELAASIVAKHKRAAELATWLTANDMSGLECSQTVEKERVIVEMAAEGYLLALEVKKPSRQTKSASQPRRRPAARARAGRA